MKKYKYIAAIAIVLIIATIVRYSTGDTRVSFDMPPDTTTIEEQELTPQQTVQVVTDLVDDMLTTCGDSLHPINEERLLSQSLRKLQEIAVAREASSDDLHINAPWIDDASQLDFARHTINSVKLAHQGTANVSVTLNDNAYSFTLVMVYEEGQWLINDFTTSKYSVRQTLSNFLQQ